MNYRNSCQLLGASMTTCNKYQISKIILSFKNAFSRYGYSQGEGGTFLESKERRQ